MRWAIASAVGKLEEIDFPCAKPQAPGARPRTWYSPFGVQNSWENDCFRVYSDIQNAHIHLRITCSNHRNIGVEGSRSPCVRRNRRGAAPRSDRHHAYRAPVRRPGPASAAMRVSDNFVGGFVDVIWVDEGELLAVIEDATDVDNPVGAGHRGDPVYRLRRKIPAASDQQRKSLRSNGTRLFSKNRRLPIKQCTELVTFSEHPGELDVIDDIHHVALHRVGYFEILRRRQVRQNRLDLMRRHIRVVFPRST